MHRTRFQAASLAALMLTLGLGVGSAARADVPPGLFSNYYVGPPGHPAQLYVSPRPTPPFVGHTWITYQPFDPHEYLYKHHRVYYRPNADGGFTKAHVHYDSYWNWW